MAHGNNLQTFIDCSWFFNKYLFSSWKKKTDVQPIEIVRILLLQGTLLYIEG